MHDAKTFNYYGLEKIDSEVLSIINKAVSSIAKENLSADTKPTEFIRTVIENEDIGNMLIHLSKLPVFSSEFANVFTHNLDLLAIAKKLKYFTNLPLSQNLLLIQQTANVLGHEMPMFDKALIKLVRSHGKLSAIRFKDYVLQERDNLRTAEMFLKHNDDLERIDPHSVYPTSIYRTCDGLSLATPDSQTIEAVCSTTVTTTIKIVNNVLDPSNKILADVYMPLGRVVALVDDKVEKHYGEKLQAYFDHHGLKLIKLIHGGNEIDKDIKNVEQILVEMKNFGVARHEPILIAGGGVIADIGGFATALYHRNTPYVMLCTSIVTGIDAGPSPRTCCDGHGFKNLYGAYHPPVLTLTDRAFWNSLHEGWIRHGIAEIIKMSVVKDKSLFELIEKAGPRLIRTKFGTEGDTDPEFEKLCDLIIGKAMEGYVRSEYGNLWETHQCRPHAYGHTWSPGYELPAGMLHGHAIATCMGYGAYLAKIENFITEEEFRRVLNLLSNMELTLYHDIMDNHDMVAAANKKVVEKRGGNLCAPVPKKLGQCGYINDLSLERLNQTLDEYKAICETYPRRGRGIQMHCSDVGLQDPSTTAGDAFRFAAKYAKETKGETPIECEPSIEDEKKSDEDDKDKNCGSYQEWIQQVQTKRNKDWEFNVKFEHSSDTTHPPEYDKFSLFHDVVEKYAMSQTSLVSKNLRNAATVTEDEKLFSPCMVGSLESQFLKMQARIMGAKKVLDVGTFTGQSAMAFAEGIPDDGKVVTLEFDPKTAAVASEIIRSSTVADKISLITGSAEDSMQRMLNEGEKFDIIFLDADKENYVKYYDLAMDGLLAKGGIILADNTLCALLYDSDDMRSQKLHEFNQYVKSDKRVEQAVLTIREGITLIRRV